MKRRAKIFLDVDIEGLLTDTLAVSDVVNFDCYESIVSSCQRVIAQYKNIQPESVKTSKLFYYKKRARSSRMNPSRIFTTTDVFRAIAEHPSGEIPIGVQWTIKGDKDDTPPTETIQESSDKDYQYEPIDRRALRKPLIEDTGTDKDEGEDEYGVPEKRRKLQNTQPENSGTDKPKKQAIINLEPNAFYRNVMLDKRSTPPPTGSSVPDIGGRQIKSSRQEKGYRKYSPDALLQAYSLVKDKGIPVDKAARIFKVPAQTLRDRVLGKIDPVNYCIGGKTLLTNEEEETLLSKVENSVEQGGVYTNVSLQQVAGELAYTCGRKKVKKAMSNSWMTGFHQRWNHRLSAIKPRKVHSSQTKSSTSAIQKNKTSLTMPEHSEVHKVTTSINMPEHSEVKKVTTSINMPEHSEVHKVGTSINIPQHSEVQKITTSFPQQKVNNIAEHSDVQKATTSIPKRSEVQKVTSINKTVAQDSEVQKITPSIPQQKANNMAQHSAAQKVTTSIPQQKVPEMSGDEQMYKVLKKHGKPGDAASSNYRWPEDIRCELLMKYGGITERQNLPFTLVTEILNMVKEYFSTVGHTRINTNTGLAGPVESVDVQAKLEEMNSAIQEKINERKKRKHPITYIQDAKMEIFRTFSTLNLSKARFNELLGWLKSLELQEGKQGRFFLTERNKLGAGLQVHYDTDATAAQRLNEIHRMRSKLNVPKTLHPVDLNSRLTAPAPVPALAPALAPATTQPEQVNPPFMLLMPSGNTAVPTTLTQFLPSNLKVIPQPAVPMINGKPVSSTLAARTQPSSTKSSIDSNKSGKSKDNNTAEKTKDTKKTQKSTPAILRRKQVKSKKDTEEKQDPVPLQLFKSYNRDSDTERNLVYDEDLIKKEPISYSDTEDDTRADPDYIPKSGKFDSGIGGGGKYETIKEMLRSDAVMPQADDPDQEDGDDQTDDSFRYVTIKSEPLDDY